MMKSFRLFHADVTRQGTPPLRANLAPRMARPRRAGDAPRVQRRWEPRRKATVATVGADLSPSTATATADAGAGARVCSLANITWPGVPPGTCAGGGQYSLYTDPCPETSVSPVCGTTQVPNSCTYESRTTTEARSGVTPGGEWVCKSTAAARPEINPCTEPGFKGTCPTPPPCTEVWEVTNACSTQALADTYAQRNNASYVVGSTNYPPITAINVSANGSTPAHGRLANVPAGALATGANLAERVRNDHSTNSVVPAPGFGRPFCAVHVRRVEFRGR